MNLQPDFLTQWQQELTDRKHLRQAEQNPWTVQFTDEAMFHLYKRAWYYGKRQSDFLIAFIANLHNPRLPSVSLLADSSPAFLQKFFQYWAVALEQNTCSKDHLKMLITLFHPKWTNEYKALLTALTPPELKMLAGKTADTRLRALIEQQLSLQAASAEILTALAFSAPLRKERRRLAAEALSQAINEPHSVSLLLKAGEFLFAAGNPDEGLWLAYTLQVIDSSPHANWKEHPLWHRLLPVYALASYPENPYRMAKQLNEQLFAGRAETSVALLDLYESMAVAMTLDLQFAGVEILKKVEILLKLRPEDSSLLYFKTQLPGGAPLDHTLLEAARQSIALAPFEAFMAMEMNRFLLLRGQAMPLELAHNLAGLYRKLYQWLPVSRFWNRSLLSSLLPEAEHRSYLAELPASKT